MKKILLVEDSATQRVKIAHQLEAAGFSVALASDARSALDLVTADFALVISDVVMPQMTGYDLCRALKARPDLASIPVMLLTSLEAPDEIFQALHAGADAFVTKTRSADRIAERVQRMLDTRAFRERAGSVRDAVPVQFLGSRIDVRASKEQALDLLISVFEDSVQANRDLREVAEKLAAKNDALIRAEALRRELSALLVHDLKSPAAGLMMMAHTFLKKQDLPPRDREPWTTVFLTAETFQRMVMNLLDISRSEDGALAVTPVDIDLARLVNDVASVLVPLRDDRRLVLEVELAQAPKTVTADAELLRRILLNLLDNAFRHTPSGGTVRLEAGREASRVRIAVSNEGEPIPRAQRERIFEKYVRLSPEKDSGYSGRGLGLTFCRIAVEAHGGTIAVEDDPRGGTLFVVRFPG